MSRRPKIPASLRYLKARLWNLSRPGFWGTAIFLSVVGLVVQEYWSNPEFFSKWQKNPFAAQNAGKSNLSNEDQAIAADIDNLPVLIQDLEQNSLPPTTPTETPQAKQQNKGLLNELVNKQQAANNIKPNIGAARTHAATKSVNPFVTQADSLLQMGDYNNGIQFTANPPTTAVNQPSVSSSAGLGLTNNTRQNPIVPTSPLRAALNQGSNQNSPNVDSRIPANSDSRIPVNSPLQTPSNLPTTQNIPVSSNTTATQTIPLEQTLPTKSLPNPNIPSTTVISTNGTSQVSSGTANVQLPTTNQTQSFSATFTNNQIQPTTNTPVTASTAVTTPATPINTPAYPVQTQNSGVIVPGATVLQGGYTNPGIQVNAVPQGTTTVISPTQSPVQTPNTVQVNGYTYP